MEKLIYKKIIAIMQEVSGIAKTKKPDGNVKYAFRSIDEVANAFHPLLSKHGVFIVPTYISSEWTQRKTSTGSIMFHQRATYKYTFYAEDGSSIEAMVEGEGQDTQDKAIGKTLSYSLKAILTQVFMIPTESTDDTDKTSQPDSVSSDPGTRYFEEIPAFDDYEPTYNPPPMLDPKTEAKKFQQNMTKPIPNSEQHNHHWMKSKTGNRFYCSVKMPNGSYCKETK